jgi:hypothetical protein
MGGTCGAARSHPLSRSLEHGLMPLPGLLAHHAQEGRAEAAAAAAPAVPACNTAVSGTHSAAHIDNVMVEAGVFGALRGTRANPSW